MTRRRARIVVLLAVGVLAGCARERDMLGNPIDGSHRVTTFAVIDGRSETLWRMSAPAPGVRSAEHVEYGKVPSGFKQEIPPGDTQPRPMIQGEKLLPRFAWSLAAERLPVGRRESGS